MNETILGQQVGAAAVVVYLIQLAKNSRFPWFSAHSDNLNRITSIILAFVTSAGILWTGHYNILSGGTLAISFPPLVQIVSGILHGFGQVMIQEVGYQVAVKPDKKVSLISLPTVKQDKEVS